MKQKVIEGLKKKILLVDEQEDSSFIESIKKDFSLTYIGKLTDIKEEKFGEFVDHPNSLTYHTAKESFFSKLQVEGIYFENKYEKPNKKDFELNPNNEHQRAMIIEDKRGQKPTWQSIFYKNYQDKLKKWQEAQSKVWNLGKTYLFIVRDINEAIIMEDKERAREVVIDFGKWITINCSGRPNTLPGNEWYYFAPNMERKRVTTEELFELYLKSTK